MDSSKSPVSSKAHAIFIPFPFQGHITPQFKLAQLFHQKGFHITFVNTVFNQNQFMSSKANDFPNLINFDFKTFDDGLDKDDRIAPRIKWALCVSSRSNFAGPLRDLVTKINEDEKSPPVTCIIGDPIMPYTIHIAQELGVPCTVLWVCSAGSFQIFKHFNLLKEKGFVPVRDETSNSSVDFVPGLSNLLGRDLPFVSEYKTNFPMKELEDVYKASGIIFNTFGSLEHDALSAISAQFPHIYDIGPLQLLQNSISNRDTKTIQCNLWEEQHECLEWLDKMKPNSVVYISFGSIATVSKDKLVELALGVLDSGYPILWTMRADTGENDTSALPPNLMKKIREKGYITSWSPQEQVLNHPSIGGFITHSGWNSTIDSITSGVPMICWPQLCVQPVNSRFICSEWGIGMEMMAGFMRDEVAKLVRELMEGAHGVEIKKKCMELKELAREAASPGGSSWLSLEELFERCNAFV